MSDVIYVNHNDEVIGHGSIMDAGKRGIIKRVVQVFLFNYEGKVLLQRRSPKAPAFPNRWNASTAGHVDMGETYLEAITREMQEEIGVSGVVLEEVGKAYLEEYEHELVWKDFCMVYAGRYDGPIVKDGYEIVDTRWVLPVEFEEWMAAHPDDFTPSCIEGWRLFKKARDSAVRYTNANV